MKKEFTILYHLIGDIAHLKKHLKQKNLEHFQTLECLIELTRMLIKRVRVCTDEFITFIMFITELDLVLRNKELHEKYIKGFMEKLNGGDTFFRDTQLSYEKEGGTLALHHEIY